MASVNSILNPKLKKDGALDRTAPRLEDSLSEPHTWGPRSTNIKCTTPVSMGTHELMKTTPDLQPSVRIISRKLTFI